MALCRTLWCFAVLYGALPLFIVFCRAVCCFAVLYGALPYCIVLCRNVLCLAALYCALVNMRSLYILIIYTLKPLKPITTTKSGIFIRHSVEGIKLRLKRSVVHFGNV
jgi:hypothetical protein